MTEQNDKLAASVTKLSQHFLTDQSVLETMVFSSDIDPRDTVLEIGAGRGALTRRLAENVKQVIAIELDKRMEPELSVLQAKYGNIQVIYGSALTAKYPKFDSIIANIPFNITEPLMNRLFKESFRSATLLVGETFGKETVTPNTRLSLLTNAYFQVDYIRDVPSACFNPEPATDCSIIQLTPKNKKDATDLRLYLLRCIWDQKTRPLNEAMSAAISQYILSKGGTPEKAGIFISQVAKNYHHPLTTRVDALTSPEFCELYTSLKKLNLKKAFGGHKPRGGSKGWRHTYAAYLG